MLEKTKVKGSSEGCDELSLIVFSGNIRAIALYEHGAFKRVKNIELESCHLIPHEGGCMDNFSSFEHGQSDKSPVEIPDSEMLDAAMTKLIEWHDEFKSRAA
ncbi:hypothetical protein GCM10008997_26900 [Halomonas salifodinae]